MPVLDIFGQDAFNMQSLTVAVNKLPYVPSKLGQMGLFARKGIPTTTALFEEKAGKIALLPTKRRGEPSSVGTTDKRKMRSFVVPHIPHDDVVLPEDVQNVRVFGSESAMETAVSVVNDKLTTMRQNHEITHEYHRIGAIKGLILDADGSTTIFDLFTEFGLSETTQDFAFSSDTTDVLGLCLTVGRAIELELGAVMFDHIHAFCGKNWFDAMVKHPKVTKAYELFQENAFLRADNRKGFEFGGIVFEEYRGKVGTVDFIDPDQCRFFVVGVPDLFIHAMAPADFMETANTIGLPVYAKQAMVEFDRGVKIHTQSNPLMMCTRPKTCVKGTKS